ncbi:hypothetical protein PUMCH_004378 [Australozyma saopauloensis]|uniref:Zn(2)-C6 fungal-type domain-containing protein n=1 Tax=Australozyma saopauloensis TaxID=291208 RepID=A0AAX4HFL2_9ASCO|nr:hypothetical protein PUMCH_004378 [[Candida] saopauloensis]
MGTSKALASPNPKQKKKKSKTFTGCFTCRSRKIRCDLLKPICKNCEKAGVTCSGYDINLRWLAPIQFRPNGRYPIQQPVVFEDVRTEDGEFFQRRNVGFVVWDEKTNCRPYETYEDIDDDLNALRASNSSSKTTLQGPFGVFTSKKAAQKRNLNSASVTPQQKPSSNATPLILEHDHLANDQLWLSNELREHALLTAAALNGDPQFLDFDVQLIGYQSVPESQSDLLNLVFHRHSHPHVQLSDTPIPSTNPMTPIPQGIANKDMSVKPEQDNIAINPTNQHLFYSNYANFYYNNPYLPNETLDIQLHASASLPPDASELQDNEHLLQTQMPEAIMSIVRHPLQPDLGFDVALPNNGVMLPITALQVQPLTRYLLNNYVTQVADLMTVIPLMESPWKTIYFPRALMAIGELSALGKTSVAKNALLNALLAVSAFNLQSKFPRNSPQMRFYLNLGIRLRNQASIFVKSLLGANGSISNSVAKCVASEKYKDILCAVMSMISVDLVWGTMQDTAYYIQCCEKVIQTKMLAKKKLSSKAKILHRIFLSMKLIQDSTCLSITNIKEDLEISQRALEHNNTKIKIDFLVDRQTVSTPMFVNKKLISTNKNDDSFATDALYGVPNSLIKLFSETVHMLRRKIYYQDTHGASPPNFREESEQLNKSIETWKLDWKLFDNTVQDPHFYSSMHEVTYHHIMSFYSALVIYFNRFIRETAPQQLQDKVATTLEHLNSIQKLIAKDEAHIIPLFWQGFIAGCEATSTELQMGFKKWGADIAQYLGSYWGARQIMLEVWRRKKTKDPKDDWISVIHDWEMNLMLN